MEIKQEHSSNIKMPEKKIYKDNAINVGTFLGGPLVAGYLIAENFKAFNDPDSANRTWIIAVITAIVVFGGIFMIPEDINIPNQLIPLVYTSIAYFLVRQYQGQSISAHINAGGELFGWWRTIGVSIIGLIITIVPIFGFALLSDSINNAAVVTKTYGIMKHEVDYDINNISETEVDLLAHHLTMTGFFDDEATKYVYVQKSNKTYELYISVVNGVTKDREAMAAFTSLRNDLQDLYLNNKIVFKLVFERLDNVVKTLE